VADQGHSVTPDSDDVVSPTRSASFHISRTAPVSLVSPRCKHINIRRVLTELSSCGRFLPAACPLCTGNTGDITGRTLGQ
jgi:hypothetical protein